MWFRSPLLAAALGALALAGCGSDDTALIPQEDADRVITLVGDAGDAAAKGACDRARRAVREAELQLSGLPRKTDSELKANIRDWLQHLDGRIAEDCQPPEPEETPTPEPTVAPTETPTPTVDPGDGGGAIPPEEPPGTGGVPPEDDG